MAQKLEMMPKLRKGQKCWGCKKEIEKGSWAYNGIHYWHEKCKEKDSAKRIKKYLTKQKNEKEKEEFYWAQVRCRNCDYGFSLVDNMKIPKGTTTKQFFKHTECPECGCKNALYYYGRALEE
jgi:hypothetical protein